MKLPLKILIGAVVLVSLAGFLLSVFVVPRMQKYYIPSGAMEPSLPAGTTLFVERHFYRDIGAVRRGDIIVYTTADSQGQPVDFIKRVVALPGDRIQMNGTNVKINGRLLPHAGVKAVAPLKIYDETNGAATYRVQYGDLVGINEPYVGVVPAGRVFCVGDNRDNSNDSRYNGAVPFDAIVGKKMF